jgi:hypothetical protein
LSERSGGVNRCNLRVDCLYRLSQLATECADTAKVEISLELAVRSRLWIAGGVG